MDLKEKREDTQAELIQLSHWEKKRSLQREEKSLANYLDILSFNELIHESKEVFQALKSSGTYCQQLALKTHLIIKEMGKRVGIESKEISQDINKMSNELEKRIQSIEK